MSGYSLASLSSSPVSLNDVYLTMNEARLNTPILGPNNAVLELLSKEFLYQSNKEKITPSFDDCRINIYAQKSTVPVILSYLDETVKSIRCQKISSDHIQEHDLDEKLLQELERITKTHIEYNKDNKVCVKMLSYQALSRLTNK